MAKRRTIFSILGGATLAALLAGGAIAQKGPEQPQRPAAPDPLVGTWTITGHNVHQCVASYPTGTMVVRPPTEAGGDYPVRARHVWRNEALPGCPPPGSPGEQTDLEGAIRRQGNQVALVLRAADGRVLGPWGYVIEGNTLRFLCETCVKTSFRWVRQSR